MAWRAAPARYPWSVASALRRHFDRETVPYSTHLSNDARIPHRALLPSRTVQASRSPIPRWHRVPVLDVDSDQAEMHVADVRGPRLVQAHIAEDVVAIERLRRRSTNDLTRPRRLGGSHLYAVALLH